jgi:hypothetical protein
MSSTTFAGSTLLHPFRSVRGTWPRLVQLHEGARAEQKNCELARLDCLGGANEPESGFSPIAFAKSSERTEGACSIPRQSGE